MKTLSHELTAEASRELVKATQAGRIVLTRGGKPVAYVLPTALYDDEDMGYMTDPAFWAMIRERRREDTRCRLSERGQAQKHDKLDRSTEQFAFEEGLDKRLADVHRLVAGHALRHAIDEHARRDANDDRIGPQKSD